MAGCPSARSRPVTTRRTTAGADQTPAATATTRRDHPEPPYGGRRAGRRQGAPTSRPGLRPGHLGAALRPGGVPPVRRARGGAAAGGDHRAGGQAAPPGAGLVRPAVAADARRAAGQARPAGPAGAGQRRRRHAAGGAQPHRRRRAAARLPHRVQRRPHPLRGAQPRRRGAARSPWSARTCRCGSRPPRSACAPTSTGTARPATRPGPGMAELELGEEQIGRLYARRGARPGRGGRAALPHRSGAALGPRLGAGPGAARTRPSGWSAATGRRSALHGRSAEQRIALDLLLDESIGHRLARRPGRHRQVRAGALRRPGGGDGAAPAQEGDRLPPAVRRRRPGAGLPARLRVGEDVALGAGGLRHPRRGGARERAGGGHLARACSRCCR